MLVYQRTTRSCLVLLSFVLASPLVADDVPNLRGTYAGLFFDSATKTFRAAAIPYIEQDNLRRLKGDLVLDGNVAGKLPFAGTIAASGVCTSVSGAQLVYQAQWEKLGNGAGALFGKAAITSQTGKSAGSLFVFRPMTAGTAAKPDVRGSYSGSFRSNNGATGNVIAQITDGTSNLLSVQLAYSTGRGVSSYVCTGDVGSDGLFVGIGVGADGNIAIVRGYIEQDNLRSTVLNADVQIKTPSGTLTEVNSIIAILIG